MYENKVHSVPSRIVSISQLYTRPNVKDAAMELTGALMITIW